MKCVCFAFKHAFSGYCSLNWIEIDRRDGLSGFSNWGRIILGKSKRV